MGLGCSAKAYVEDHRAAATAKIERVRGVAALVRAAPPLASDSKVRDAGVPISVCEFWTFDPSVDAACNAQLIDLSRLEDSDPGSAGDFGNRWTLPSWFELPSEMMKHGRVRRVGLTPESTTWFDPPRSTVKRHFDELERLAYLFVVKPVPGRYSELMEVFLYDVRATPVALGGFTIGTNAGAVRLVYASGPNAGQFAGTNDPTGDLLREDFIRKLTAQVPTAKTGNPRFDR